MPSLPMAFPCGAPSDAAALAGPRSRTATAWVISSKLDKPSVFIVMFLFSFHFLFVCYFSFFLNNTI